MDKKRLFWVTALTLLLLGTLANTGFGQKTAPDILAGLTTAAMRVSYYEEGSLRNSSSEGRQLASDLEKQLGETGLKLVSEDELERLLVSRGYPAGLLDLDVRTSKMSGVEIQVYYISVKLYQVCYVARKPVLRFMASTWDLTDTGTADDFNAVRGRVREAVARFVGDFRAENPG